MKSDECPICKSYDTYQMYPADVDVNKLSFTYSFSPESNKTFRVVRCRNCTHVFCSPIQKDIYKNYEDVVDSKYLKYAMSLKLAAHRVLPVIKRYRPQGLILDVGCATGDFLIEAKKYGYSVEGLELSRWSCDIARNKNIHVYRKRLKSLAQQFPGRYDVITMWGVIEHFECPIEEMNYINKILKPGGILALWTGDINSLSSRILGRHWWYWQGQHIQYFTHQSLNYLIKSCDFEHITTKTYPFVATYELLDNSLSRYSLRPWIMKIVRPLFAIKPIWTFRLPGEMLYIARKKTVK